MAFEYSFDVRVRYGDTDQMGFVYYGNYAYYYEQARSEAIRSLGVPYKEIEASGVIMPITRMNIKYIYPAHYDDLLTIKVKVPELPGRLIRFIYDIYNEEGMLINEGETVLIFLDAKSKKLRSIPQVLLEKLSPFFD